MKLTSINTLRRTELRRAAFAVLQTEGVAGATLEKVAAHAGASKGIVLHYFKNKQELFEHAMREANKELAEDVAARLKRARTASERIEAIIAGNFDGRFFKPPMAHAWLQLCAEVPRDPQLARIQRVIHARMHSNLSNALRELVDSDRVQPIALSISAFIDGLWLRLGLGTQTLAPAEAEALVRQFAQALIETGKPDRAGN